MSSDDDTLIPETAAAILLDAGAPVDPGPEARARMKNRLLERVREAASAEFVTVRDASSEWIETSPGNTIKILRSDEQTMSILVRLEPGTTFPQHYHPADEETYVVEGETWFGDIHLVAGDYHLAPKGTTHGEVRTETGCVLLIRKASE